MQTLYPILEVINYVVIGVCTLSMAFQMIMILFFWLPEKHFPKAEKLHKIALIICARNESSVIFSTVQNIFEHQDYPKDLYDVYVVADNCDDDTAALAKKAGAIVLEHFDENPAHHKVAYPLAYGLAHILETKKYDFVIRIDADNLLKDDYFRRMNDAFASGVEIARPFEASRNPTQNTWATVSATYYMRDSFIACNFREFFHLDSMLTGAGMMVATKTLEEIGGWDAFSASEDAEFTCKRLCEKRRVHYVADAVVYEDMPSTLKDTHARNARMGNGLTRVFWKDGWKMLGHFFVSGRWSNVDLFVQLLVVPVAVLCVLWFPLYYAFYAIAHLINAVGPEWLANVAALDGGMLTAAKSASLLLDMLLPMIGIVLGSYLVLYPFQTLIAVVRSKKKLGLKNLKGYKRGILLSPLLMILNAISITVGVLGNAGWKSVSRNSEKSDQK
ncbi:MAG: glycosyltransferase family 2 protein [Candidatus Enteromonas sp.]|nr:glycosyltransferase family 2 protein [Candidatus Enteromonas sp.]